MKIANRPHKGGHALPSNWLQQVAPPFWENTPVTFGFKSPALFRWFQSAPEAETEEEEEEEEGWWRSFN